MYKSLNIIFVYRSTCLWFPNCKLTISGVKKQKFDFIKISQSSSNYNKFSYTLYGITFFVFPPFLLKNLPYTFNSLFISLVLSLLKQVLSKSNRCCNIWLLMCLLKLKHTYLLVLCAALVDSTPRVIWIAWIHIFCLGYEMNKYYYKNKIKRNKITR